jgi:hypothetical protein
MRNDLMPKLDGSGAVKLMTVRPSGETTLRLARPSVSPTAWKTTSTSLSVAFCSKWTDATGNGAGLADCADASGAQPLDPRRSVAITVVAAAGNPELRVCGIVHTLHGTARTTDPLPNAATVLPLHRGWWNAVK